MRHFPNFDSSELIELIKEGAVGSIPTDTIYGIVASAKNEQAVSKLYNLKNRDKKPGTLIAASIEQVVELGVKRRYLTAVEQFWPGPVSVVIPTSGGLDYLDLGKKSLAIRIPASKELRKLLQNTGPLLTTSANPPGLAPANNVEKIETYFKDQLEFLVEGGDLTSRPPSAVIRIVDDAVEVLRPGPGFQ